MLFAVTIGRARPARGDVLTGRAHLDAILASGASSLVLWEAVEDDEDGLGFMRVGKPVSGTGGAREALRTRALGRAAPLYNTGDCWVMAHVAGLALGRPVALFRSPVQTEPDVPDHLAVDLGGGLYLDARGTITAEAMAEGLLPGSRPAGTIPAEGVAALFDRFYAEDGYAFADKIGGGFEESTRILFETFLEAEARAAVPAHEPGAPTP